MLDYRDRFEHHLLLTVSATEKEATQGLLTAFFAGTGRDGSFFACTASEAQSAMLQRFAAASAVTRYFNLHRDTVSGMITFDVALRRNDTDWLEVLPEEITDQLEVSAYFGHFFCHVLHQNHVAKKGVDTAALKKTMKDLLEKRGAAIPAEHNYGRIYRVPAAMEAHFKKLDPHNIFNAGIGETSPHKNWT